MKRHSIALLLLTVTPLVGNDLPFDTIQPFPPYSVKALGEGVSVLSNRRYVIKSCPEEYAGWQFMQFEYVPVRNNGHYTVRSRRKGRLHVLCPVRHKDILIEGGWRLVDRSAWCTVSNSMPLGIWTREVDEGAEVSIPMPRFRGAPLPLPLLWAAGDEPLPPIRGAPLLRAAGDEPSRQILHSIIVIEGDQTVGSGFVADVFGKTVVVTNAHVCIGNQKLRFKKTDGDSIAVGQVRIGRGVDVAFFDLPEWEGPVLTLARDVESAITLGSKVVVYGNSDGAGVVTHLEGAVNGIKRDRIEVTAQFVQENTGGPVIAAESGQVVGVATYATRMTPNWVTEARFEEVRFALRVDMLAPGDFEPMDLKAYARYLPTYRTLYERNRKVFAFLRAITIAAGGTVSLNKIYELEDPKLRKLAELLFLDISNLSQRPQDVDTSIRRRFGQVQLYLAEPAKRVNAKRVRQKVMRKLLEDELDLNDAIRAAVKSKCAVYTRRCGR